MQNHLSLNTLLLSKEDQNPRIEILGFLVNSLAKNLVYWHINGYQANDKNRSPTLCS